MKSDIVGALQKAGVRYGQTIMMPTQSWKNLDPQSGVHWDEPKEWWQTIRDYWPAYNKDITPTNTMGAVAEMFRKWPGAMRSNHPARSVAAVGRYAEYPGKRMSTESSAMMVNGKREWVTYQTLYVDGGDFEEIGQAFEMQGKTSRESLGNGSICLMQQRELVDFAVSWIQRNRGRRSYEISR